MTKHMAKLDYRQIGLSISRYVWFRLQAIFRKLIKDREIEYG